jgi:hypothetical protein
MLKEFSKKILAIVMACFLLGVAYGAIIIWRSPDQLSSYLGYIGAPTAVAIGFYAWKAKAENVVKLTKRELDKLDRANIS